MMYGVYHRKNFGDLSETANIENIPEVFLNIELDSFNESLSNPWISNLQEHRTR